MIHGSALTFDVIKETAAVPQATNLRTVAQTWSYTAVTPRLQQSLVTVFQVESWTTVAPRLQQSLRSTAQVWADGTVAPRLQQSLRTITQTWLDSGLALRLTAALGAGAFVWHWTASSPRLGLDLTASPRVWAYGGVAPRLTAPLRLAADAWGWSAAAPALQVALQAPSQTLAWVGVPIEFPGGIKLVPQAWDWSSQPPRLSLFLRTALLDWTYAGSPAALLSILSSAPQAWTTTGLPPTVGEGAQQVTAVPQVWRTLGVQPRLSYRLRTSGSAWAWSGQQARLLRPVAPPSVQPQRSSSVAAIWAGASVFVPPEDPPDSAVVDVWASPSRVLFEGSMPAAVVYLPNSPYIAGTTFPVYGQIVDIFGNGIPASRLVSLTLTIFDTLTGIIINDVFNVNILNVDRGTVDESGNLVILNQPGDTSMSEVPGAASVQRSYGLNWVYNSSAGSGIGGFVIGVSPIGGGDTALVGAQQIDFTLINPMSAQAAASSGFTIGVSPIGVGPIG